MNQREALLILYEATLELPETRSLRRARRWAQKRLEVLRLRYARMRGTRALARFQQHIEACTQCRTRNRCEVGAPLLDLGLRSLEEADGREPYSLSGDADCST